MPVTKRGVLNSLTLFLKYSEYAKPWLNKQTGHAQTNQTNNRTQMDFMRIVLVVLCCCFFHINALLKGKLLSELLLPPSLSSDKRFLNRVNTPFFVTFKIQIVGIDFFYIYWFDFFYSPLLVCILLSKFLQIEEIRPYWRIHHTSWIHNFIFTAFHTYRAVTRWKKWIPPRQFEMRKMKMFFPHQQILVTALVS